LAFQTDSRSTDGLAVVGKYYDTNGRLQTASNLSTTGIIEVPVGIKDIYYNAYRNITIPTILFFNASMQIVGTVIATTAPVYGDTSYSGYAEIPSTAKYMEFSMNNTIAGQIVTVRYSKVDNNVARITELETDPLYGKKITCTGDSITAATHSYPGHSYVDQIAQAHGMTVDNKAIWGAVFAQNQVDGEGNSRGCIYDTIALMDATADIVIISGGINDAEYYADETYWGTITDDYDDTLDTETFCGALEAICKTALQKWSGKPIIFVFEHRMTLDNTTYGAHFNDVQYPLMVEILEKWGISYVDLYHDMPSLSFNEGYKTAYTTGDGVHPNIAGYAKFYVPRVYSKIKEVMGI
jgi:lysophospholipase L1-like esterase